MTWTGTALLITNNIGDELFTFPDPADLTAFTVQALPSRLTRPVAMTWTGTAPANHQQRRRRIIHVP